MRNGGSLVVGLAFLGLGFMGVGKQARHWLTLADKRLQRGEAVAGGALGAVGHGGGAGAAVRQVRGDRPLGVELEHEAAVARGVGDIAARGQGSIGERGAVGRDEAGIDRQLRPGLPSEGGDIAGEQGDAAGGAVVAQRRAGGGAQAHVVGTVGRQVDGEPRPPAQRGARHVISFR